MAKAPKSFPPYAKGYTNLWNRAELVKRKEALAIADRILKVYNKYTPVTKATSVPEWVIAILHYRESNLNFETYLGNGQSLIRKTTIKPIGRGPFRGEGAFLRGCIDAIELKGFQNIKNWTAARFLYESERYNGFGYFMRGVNSPYVWGGTNLQQRGKFVSDGVKGWNPDHWDTQLGSAAILKALCERSPAIDAQVNPKAAPAELKTSRDVHDEVQGGKPMDQVVDEHENIPKPTEPKGTTMFTSDNGWQMIRYILIGGGAFLAGKGYVTHEQVNTLVDQLPTIISGLTAVGGIIWGLVAKMGTKTVTVETASRPDVPTVSAGTGGARP